jgi:hypothetical protein
MLSIKVARQMIQQLYRERNNTRKWHGQAVFFWYVTPCSQVEAYNFSHQPATSIFRVWKKSSDSKFRKILA